MAPYDSDSSGEDDGDYTETNVLLGYAAKEPTDDTFSQLGGYPTWLDESTPPSLALAKCAVCSSPTTLLLQLNGDLPAQFPGHERRLYVFGCRRKACRRKDGSVRALRAVRVSAAVAAADRKKREDEAAERARREEEDRTRREKQGTLGSALFGGPTPAQAAGGNPFAANPFAPSSSGSSNPANPFAGASSLASKPAQAPSSNLAETFAQKARISAAAEGEGEKEAKAAAAPARPHEPWPPRDALPPAYPSYHLDADYETLAPEDDSIPANAQLDPNAADPDDAAAAEGSGAAGGGGKVDKETFESLMDKAFQTFADRLAHNPDQVLRYEWRGAPLLCSTKDRVGKLLAPAEEKDGEGKVKTVGGSGAGAGMPRCGNCGAQRVFEVQLTPQAIAELEAEELGLEGMEWGTIIVGVCEKDCAARDVKDGEVGYVEEWAGVQWEEVAERRK